MPGLPYSLDMIVPVVQTTLFFTSLVSVAVAAAPAPAVSGSPAPAVFGIDVGDVPATYPNRYKGAGAYVVRVAPNSPAEGARLLPGDVVVHVHGNPVTDHASFRTATASLSAGNSIDVGIRRYGRSMTLNVVPIASDAMYPKAPTCEPDAIGLEQSEATVSMRRRDFENVRMHAARALDFAETCAGLHQKPDGQAMLNVAEAFSEMGAAAAAQSERDAANSFLGNAWVVYRLVATAPGTSSDQRQTATAKAASLERRVASISAIADGGIAEGLAYMGSALGPSPFTIVNSWNTSGENYARLLHVRISMNTARDALLFANFFRVSIPTDDGPEVYFAIEGAGHAGPRIMVPGRATKTEIAPEEDLSLLGHTFAVAGAPQTYVLTFVVGDLHADLTNTASTLAYLPQ